MELLEPWQPVDDGEDSNRRWHFERELILEVGPHHPLYSMDATVVGVRCDCDDTLFQLNDGSGRMAVVHLTWRGAREPMPWPATELFESWEVFAATRMQTDNTEFDIG